ncbi:MULTISPECIES: transcription antitermination factor NusB [unclassified Agrococcus]|uniref:transcription antitermination factor NusB n=1 Tax=unclassified Agrococcus TaxID=2615065 RepID=UPI003620A391
MTQQYPSRRKARKHAVEIGYSAIVRDADPIELLRVTTLDQGWSKHPWFAYCEELVTGVAHHDRELDELLEQSSEHWSLERMARIDLAILRVGAWELAHNPAVPNEVAISEAVHLAGELSTERSSTFVNGVLAQVAGQVG